MGDDLLRVAEVAALGITHYYAASASTPYPEIVIDAYSEPLGKVAVATFLLLCIVYRKSFPRLALIGVVNAVFLHIDYAFFAAPAQTTGG